MDGMQFREDISLNRQHLGAGVYPRHHDTPPKFSISASTRTEPGKSRGQSRLQINTTSFEQDSSKSLRRPAPPSPLVSESLLAYARDPTPSPPTINNFIRTPLLPHPHAPKAPPSHVALRPAIHRSSSDATSASVSPISPSHKALLDALAMAATAGHTQGPLQGKATIHGRTSHDLLSAPGPVPIEFALNRHEEQTEILQDGYRAEFVVPLTEVAFAPECSESAPSGSSIHISDAPNNMKNPNLMARPRLNASVGKARPRSRSFSDIISAFETPSLLPLGTQPEYAHVHLPSSHTLEHITHSLPSTPTVDDINGLELSQATAHSHSSTFPPAPATGQAQSRRAGSPSLRRKLSKPAPLRNLSQQGSPNPPAAPLSAPLSSPISRFKMGESASVPPSPPSLQNHDIYATKSIPDLRLQTSDQNNYLPGGGKSIYDSTDSFHAYVLEDYGVELNSEWTGTIAVQDDTSQLTVSSPSLASSPVSQTSRTQSLRSRISLPALRGSARRRQDSIQTTEVKEETVEVEDMEFTLIRPTATQYASARDSEDTASDSARSLRDTLSIPTDSALPDRDSSRSFSPSPLSPRSPSPLSASPFDGTFTISLDQPPVPPSVPIRTANQRSIQSHRQLELKWISAMGATPSADAKKSRKIRRLVIEGIPASVRGVVWLYLTDSKGRRMPGLYPQLCKRGRVAASNDIWIDIQSRFQDHQHLRDPDGPLMLVLQAYLCMVPDTEYSYGLALIAGHILLQTPEEDAFWTFVALMDNHPRGYFSPTARLLEVDVILFEKAVISFDKGLATRLFTDLQVKPMDFCRHWFTTLYAVVLPPTHLNRTWDAVMYFEGPTFLFRLGLAVLTFCRSFLLDTSRCRSSADALAFLLQPPADIFPSDPDQIISTAMAVKLREDDMRKLRPKVDAQLKKQTLSARPPIFAR